MNLGDLQLDVVRAGEFWLDGGAMFGVVPRVIWERLTPPDSSNRIRLQTNCMLVRGDDAVVLVDTGIGHKEDERFRKRFRVDESGDLVASLAALGVDPDDITHVVLSHLHWDHAGGATRRDARGVLRPTYPRARYVVQRGEWDDATAATERTRASYRPDNFLPLEGAGALELVEGEQEIAPGVRVTIAPGHNQHMQAVHVRSGGKTAIFLSDLVPTRHHLRYPFIMSYDLFPETTLKTKREYLPRIHEEKWLLVFDHDPDLPLATLERNEDRQLIAVAPATGRVNPRRV